MSEPSPNTLVLQINSLQALERLIGGDAQVEVDARNSVVQNFAKKHLGEVAKNLAIGPVVKSIENDLTRNIKMEAETQLGRVVKERWNDPLKFVPTTNYSSAVESYSKATISKARLALEKQMQESLDAVVASTLETAQKTLARSFEQSFDKAMSAYIEKEVNRRMGVIISTITTAVNDSSK